MLGTTRAMRVFGYIIVASAAMPALATLLSFLHTFL